MSDAAQEQARPLGTGREIAPLIRESVMGGASIFQRPSDMEELRCWIRGAALWLKYLRLERDHPGAFHSDLGAAVLADIEERTELGRRKYGEALRAHNGRDALLDAYQELLNCWQYLEQDREERGE